MRKRTASADMLSRNISIILENLLKSYEQSQLPTHGQGGIEIQGIPKEMKAFEWSIILFILTLSKCIMNGVPIN